MFEGGGLQDKSILLSIRSPHHYMPLDWSRCVYYSFFGMLMLGLIGLKVRRPERGDLGPPRVVLISMLALLAIGFLFTTAIYVTPVAALFLFRVAPFVALAALIAVAGAVASLLSPERDSRHIPAWLVLAAICFTTVLVRPMKGPEYGLLFHSLIILTLAALLAANATRGRLAPYADRIPKAILIVLIAVVAFVAWEGIRESNVFRDKHSRTFALYTWIRSNTPSDAMFIVPPKMPGFRLLTRRAIVADWKCFPMKASDADEWLRRMELISGRHDIKGYSEVNLGYRLMNVKRVSMLAREFDSHWLVMKEPQNDPNALKAFQKVYSGRKYSVYHIE